MTQALLALGPIFLLILLGALLKRKQLVSDVFWEPAELLTYYVFFPALLLRSIASADLSGLDILPMTAALLAGVLFIAGVTIATRRYQNVDGPAFTSIFQGSIRPNTYVGVAAAAGLWGDPGLTLVAVALAFVVPTVNVLSVMVMAIYARPGGGEGVSGKNVVLQIVRNPIVLACALGGLVNALGGNGLPPVMDGLFEILARAALPIGLLAVGAGLNLSAMSGAGLPLLTSAGLKLVLLPLVTFGACIAFGVEGITALIAICYASLPVSASSYVLARTLDGDAELMAGIITFTTLASMITMPLVIFLLGLI